LSIRFGMVILVACGFLSTMKFIGNICTGIRPPTIQ
jgi:hypothetical protein